MDQTPAVRAWARMFSRAGWDAEYLPQEVPGYSLPPAFMIHGHQPCIAVLYSAMNLEDWPAAQDGMRAMASMLASRTGYWSPHIVLLADGPLDVRPDYEDCGDPGPGYYVAGPACWGNSPSLLNWHVCQPENAWCGQLAWHNTMDSFESITCGHHDGDGHLNRADERMLKRMWQPPGLAQNRPEEAPQIAPPGRRGLRACRETWPPPEAAESS